MRKTLIVASACLAALGGISAFVGCNDSGTKPQPPANTCSGTNYSSAITLIAPDSGDVFAAGSTVSLDWCFPAAVTSYQVQIEYSINDGIDWLPITTTGGVSLPNHSYSWAMPATVTGAVLIRVGKYGEPGTFFDLVNITVTP